MNPSAEYEASILDEAIRTVQEKIEKMEKIQQQVIPLLKNSSKLAVISIDDFPTAFMYYGWFEEVGWPHFKEILC